MAPTTRMTVPAVRDHKVRNDGADPLVMVTAYDAPGALYAPVDVAPRQPAVPKGRRRGQTSAGLEQPPHHPEPDGPMIAI